MSRSAPNTTIDRGTIRDTSIGRGTKIDNLVQVGHNVVVGEDCLLCGQVGIAGSTRIGNRVVLGGQVGVVDNILVGDDVVAGAGDADHLERAGRPGDDGLARRADGPARRDLQGAAPVAENAGASRRASENCQDLMDKGRNDAS